MSLTRPAKKKNAPCGAGIPIRVEGTSVKLQQHHPGYYYRTTNKQDGRQAAPPPVIAPLCATLGDQRRLIFVGGRKHAGETAASQNGGRFERHQVGLGISSTDQVHGRTIWTEW